MKRKVLAILLMVTLLAGMVIAPVGASAATKVKILKVTADGARVRKGPSSAYDVKTSVKKGGKVFYLNKNQNSFAYVRTSTGTNGWMYKGFLSSYGTCYKSQIYYSKNTFDVQKAQRFFKERGVKFQSIDLKEKGLSKGEFTSVMQAVGGVDAMIDPDCKDKDLLALVTYISADERMNVRKS